MADAYAAPRKRARASQRSTNPISEVFDSNKEVTFPRGQMIDILNHFMTDLDVLSATDYKLNYLLGAGIQLKRKQYKLNEKKAETFSLRGQAFVELAWIYLWCLRFVAVIVDEFAAGRGDDFPFLILKVEQLEVKYFQDPLGRRWFRYFLPGGGSDVISKEIPNVITFFLKENILDPYGNICSTVTALMPDVEDVQCKRMTVRTADWNRANPLMVTEKPMPKNDPDNISALPLQYEPQGPVTADKPTMTDVNNSTGDMWKSRVTPTDLAGISKSGTIARPDAYDQIMNLPEGRTVANPQMAEAPTDFLATAALKKENVYLAFGIPLGMISNASSSTTMKAASGNAGGKKSEGQNSSAKEMFYVGLAEMRHFTIGMLEKLLNDYYMREHVEQVKADTKKEQRSMEEIGEEAYIKCVIPGRADMDTILQYYQMGAIKYSYLKQAASAVYFIPDDAWESEPQLGILELNGMQEKPEPSKK